MLDFSAGMFIIVSRRRRIVMKFWIVFLALAVSGCRAAESTPVVPHLDIRKFMGTWYEQARTPNWFQKGLTGVSAHYTLLPDGRIKVVNSGFRKGKRVSITGYARFASKQQNGELEVSFFPPFYAPYRVVLITPDYSFAVIMGGSPEYVWLLSRQKTPGTP